MADVDAQLVTVLDALGGVRLASDYDELGGRVGPDVLVGYQLRVYQSDEEPDSNLTELAGVVSITWAQYVADGAAERTYRLGTGGTVRESLASRDFYEDIAAIANLRPGSAPDAADWELTGRVLSFTVETPITVIP